MNPAAPYAYAALLGILAWSAWSDIKTERIPNVVTIPAILAGIVFWAIAALINGQSVTAAINAAAFAGLAAFIPCAIIFILGGIGAGDVKVMTIVGTWSASGYCVLGTTIYGLIATIFIAFAIMIKKQMVKETILKLYAALLQISNKSSPELADSKTNIPLVVSIFIGTIFSGMEYMLGYKFPWTA